MNDTGQQERCFWTNKILHLLHDPPAKPYFLRSHSGGHGRLAKEIIAAVFASEQPKKKLFADYITAGADRPVFAWAFDKEHGLGIRYFHTQPLVTHPLDQAPLLLNHPHAGEKSSAQDMEWLRDTQISAVKKFSVPTDATAGELKEVFFLLWRLLRKDLADITNNDAIWQFMPADSRCPDHSIWEHNRMTSALAFVNRKLETGREREPDHPWLFSFALRPVQEFLAQARKSQDLWIGSMLLAELSFAAMEPIIEHYGPDVIVYPDLRENPRADNYLRQRPNPVLEQGVATRAAVIPHTFVAILPRGDDAGHLYDIKKMGRKCADRVQARWQKFSGEVRSWMEKVVAKDKITTSWQQLWEFGTSHCPLEPTWVASPWPVLAEQENYYLPGRALPCQDEKRIQQFSEKDQQAIDERHKKLGRWMSEEVRDRYDFIISVFAANNKKQLLNSGVLYAQAHHKLKAQHGLRRRIMTLPEPPPPKLNLEKCTICHLRPALGNDPSLRGGIDSIRAGVRELWKNRDLDPEEQGSERLCPVCAVRRFLSRSDSGRKDNEKLNGFNRICFGPDKTKGEVQDRDKRVRTPFPSTVQIAAQEYLAGLQHHTSALSPFMTDIIGMHQELGLGRPSFVRALPRLAVAADAESLLGEFLALDPQLSLFPEMIQARVKYEQDSTRENMWIQLFQASTEFRKKADKLLKTVPETRVAVLTMDGDRMGDLLLGMPERIHACWKDILHPDIDKKVREKLADTGWGDLRRMSRSSGPALHAFISRALADFNHHIAPWVVEQEFGGRLIYSGGDDLLALVPVNDALPLAARLRELFRAPWLVDTRPEQIPWSWLEQNRATWEPKTALKRFHPITSAMLQTEQKEITSLLEQGQLRAMLGSSGMISAGICCGHFKTRMGLLLKTSHDLLEEWAKERAGRDAVGVGHFSRNGIKTMYAASWDLGESNNKTTRRPGPVAPPQRSMSMAKAIELVVDAFRKGTLAKGLPYKLVTAGQGLDPLQLDVTPDQGLQILRGLLATSLDSGKTSDELRDAVLHLWAAGYRLHRNDKDTCAEPGQFDRYQGSHQPLAGLFFCRYLQGGE